MKAYKPQLTAKRSQVASPCVRNCCLNERDICLGCFRSLDEIMAWQKLEDSAKQKVLDLCRQRQQQARPME
ncbi:Predicted Fe-S protein YdhL, DUF1289 family [Colwellia chukchiensis]|uniref:Predicted Fe-S protein YdhL, DUF1289 family n=1 Tax=Colwellia chukchiensis TaxID=641665 RepID=A0A1H7T7P2_9GAMM|nr:DUF1289 domain-containing protein [Colwellia chukchiensis]SEL80922.1 Predicted Fe-S protein YdhL, DUF1289 family [Colwellia chukchiensis]